MQRIEVRLTDDLKLAIAGPLIHAANELSSGAWRRTESSDRHEARKLIHRCRELRAAARCVLRARVLDNRPEHVHACEQAMPLLDADTRAIVQAFVDDCADRRYVRGGAR